MSSSLKINIRRVYYTLKYIEGKRNIITDIFNRYHIINVDRSSVEEMAVVETKIPGV